MDPHTPSPTPLDASELALPGPWELVFALAPAAAATGIASLAGPLLSESDVIMLYVAGVTVTAFRARLVTGLGSAVLSALAFNFFFTAPRYTLAVDDSRYWLTFAMMGGIGVLASALAARLRQHAAALALREAQAQAMVLFTHRLSRCGTPDEVAEVAAQHLHRVLTTPTVVWLGSAGALRRVARVGAVPDGTGEQLAAQWAAAHGLAAGAGANTPWPSRVHYRPVGGEGAVLGVLGFLPPDAASVIEPSTAHAVDTVVTLLREFLERLALEAAAETARLAVETERVRSTLLSTVSHDLRTPLATITGAATTLLDPAARLHDHTRRELLERVSGEARRLERLVDNVLRMTRLDGGQLTPALEWELPDELVASAVARVAAQSPHRVLRVQPSGRPVLARLDAVLVEQLVVNYLENALAHAGGDAPIDVAVRVQGAEVAVEVADRGTRPLPERPERLFEKFVRGEASGGAGLGLAISHAVAMLHGGRVWAHPRPGGGALFGAAFPLGGPDDQPVPTYEDVLDQAEPR